MIDNCVIYNNIDNNIDYNDPTTLFSTNLKIKIHMNNNIKLYE